MNDHQNDSLVENNGETIAPRVIDIERVLDRIEYVWRRKGILLKLATVGAIVGVLLALSMPSRYEATALVMPPDASSNSAVALLAGGMGSGLPYGMMGDLLGMKTPGELYVGAMRSEHLENAIIDRFDLRAVYKKKYWAGARKKLEARTELSVDRKSGMISIAVTDADPNRAAELANAYADELEKLLVKVNASAATKQREYLEERINVARQELADATSELSTYASTNKTIDLNEQGKAMVGAYANVEGQIIAAQSELRGLQKVYTDQDVHVTAAQARIAELQRQLARLSGTGKESKHSTSSGDVPSIAQLPIVGVGYLDRYRKTKIREAVFEALNQEYELSKLQQERNIAAVQVLSPATPPEKEKSPIRIAACVIGPMLFLIGGIVFVLAVSMWDDLNAGDPRRRVIRRVADGLPAKAAYLRWAVRLCALSDGPR